MSFQEISDFSDKQLKALLDEAMTYKNPKDLAHKSETFKVSICDCWAINCLVISSKVAS